MVDSIGSATSAALAGLLAAEKKLEEAAVSIATGTVSGQGSTPVIVAGGDSTAAIVELLNAKIGFAANIETLKATDSLTKKLLDITV